MEEQNQPAPLFDLQADENVKEQLTGLSKWTLIVAIAAIIGLVLSIVEIIMARQQTVDYGSFRVQSERSTSLAWVAIIIIIRVLLIYMLYQFSVFTKRGVDNLSQADLNRGLGNLKSYFMTLGILLIIAFALILIFALLAGAGSLSRY